MNSKKRETPPDRDNPKKTEANTKNNQTRNHPIVAVGASAGGLEALQTFFSNMPADCGVGFVVITHTSPGRVSVLPELLSNVTQMEVVSTEDEMPVGPNKIVVAKDSLLTIQNGVLRHVKYDHEAETMYHPIDHFFRELAADQKERAIGVILSGSGNDGTLGLKAIKAAGGMVMVQDPQTAKYPSMPENAQSTGLVDYVLDPRDMGSALVEYCGGPYFAVAREKEVSLLSEEAVHSILVRLRSHSGHDFTCYKMSTMARRIERRMTVNRVEAPKDYLTYVRENPRELDLLLQELLISVTSFFRDHEAFVALGNKALPELLGEQADGYKARVWIPGCATGEEAYSVAILLDEQIRKMDRMREVQIYATDLDQQAIEVARNGLYPSGIAADVTKERLDRYFTQEDGSYRIHKNIRDMIVFAQQNVVSDPPFTRMDLIVCRNLLIYLNGEAQRRVLPLFHYALRPGGILFLGSSETITGSEDLFEMMDTKHKIMRRRHTATPLHPVVPVTRPGEREAEGESYAMQAQRPNLGSIHLVRNVEQFLLNQFAPCSIVVDERDTVIYLHGISGMYFQPEQGQPRNRIVEMAREGLRFPLAKALRQVREGGEEVTESGLRIRTNGDFAEVDLSVKSLNAPESLRGLVLVTLSPTGGSPKRLQTQLPEVPLSEPADQSELERELQYTRESLQTTIEELETSNEELKSSNEELQSTNEELQSSNEELETSREEMQSLNEELNTVNAELKSKVEALARSNDDMNNLLNSIQVATIFLDSDLRVKRYTKQARDIIRLIDSDIGRPLADLTSSLQYDNLIEDCRRVLATLIPEETEVENETGESYLVRLIPYRTAENVIVGVVLTIVDIDRVKRTGVEGRSARRFFEGIVQTVRHPLVALDKELRIVNANDAFYSVFEADRDRTEGRLIYELDNGQWDIGELRRLLEEILPKDTVMNDFRVEHNFPRIGHQIFLLNARRLKGGDSESERILLAFEKVREKES